MRVFESTHSIDSFDGHPDTDGVRNRTVRCVAASYVTARLAIALTYPPRIGHADSRSYRWGVSFTGNQARPWVVPLVQWALPDRGVVAFQAILSAVAFLVFAYVVACQMHDRRVSIGIAATILAVGISPRVTIFDLHLLSESIAISTTLLLLASLVHIADLPAALPIATFALWLFTRDAHLYLGALVCAGVGWWSWRNRRPVVAVGMVAVLAWGAVAARNNTVIEEYNVTANPALRATSDIDMFRWFVDRGMPPVSDFFEPDLAKRMEALLANSDYVAWLRDEGVNVYVTYLATHPRFLVSAFGNMFVDRYEGHGSMFDRGDQWMGNSPIGVPFWPERATLFMTALVAAAALAALRHRRFDRRWVLPTLMLASTMPHLLLVFHATPLEYGRHGVIMALVVVLTLLWITALSVDRAAVAT